MVGKAKRAAAGPRLDESNDAVPDTPTEPAKPTIDDLAKVGYQLDELVPKQGDSDALALDPAADIADQISAAAKAEPDAADALSSLADSITSRHADTRLAIARILASYAITRQSTMCRNMSNGGANGCTGWSSACVAFDKFSSADMLNESARDIVAAAILMPKADFRRMSVDLGGDIRKLAINFSVPVGAVALRRRILQLAPD